MSEGRPSGREARVRLQRFALCYVSHQQSLALPAAHTPKVRPCLHTLATRAEVPHADGVPALRILAGLGLDHLMYHEQPRAQVLEKVRASDVQWHALLMDHHEAADPVRGVSIRAGGDVPAPPT